LWRLRFCQCFGSCICLICLYSPSATNPCILALNLDILASVAKISKNNTALSPYRVLVIVIYTEAREEQLVFVVGKGAGECSFGFLGRLTTLLDEGVECRVVEVVDVA